MNSPNSTMQSVIAFIIMLCFSTSVAYAQTFEKKTEEREAGFFVSLIVDGSSVNQQELNTILLANNLPESNHSGFVLGVDFKIIQNRWVYSLGLGSLKQREEDDAYLNTTRMQLLYFTIGYDFLKPIKYILSPFAGIGFRTFDYVYQERIPNGGTFTSYIQSNQKYIELNNSQTHINLGLSWSMQKHALLELRMGYHIPISTSKWFKNKTDNMLSEAPSLIYTYYVSVAFGIGFIERVKPNAGNSNRRYNPYRQALYKTLQKS